MDINLLMEDFDLDCMDITLSNYDGFNLLATGNIFIENRFTEATDNATSENVFKKIWVFIKNILKWIMKRLVNFVQLITSLFSKKKTISVDAILETLNVTGTYNIGTGNNTVNIPSSKGSDYNPPDVKLMVKPVKIKINNDNSMTFNISGIMNKVSDEHEVDQGGFLGFNKNIPIRGQKFAGNSVKHEDKFYYINLLHTMCILMNPEYMNNLINISTNIKNQQVDTNTIDIWKYFLNDLNVWMKKPPFDITITLKQILEFQSNINKIHEDLEILDSVNLTIDSSDYIIINLLNDFSMLLAGFQMGVNQITAVSAGIYQIDASYFESIKDINTLSKFAEECVKADIPSKFIANNLYLVSSPNIKGTKGNANNPVWGQSRVVFFPSDNDGIIYKLALSGWGIRSNKAEYDIFNIFKKYGGEKLLASTIGISKEGGLIVAEKVKTLMLAGLFDVNGIIELKYEIHQFCKDFKIPLSIDGDLHGDNVGKINGRFVALDYAWPIRRLT